MVKFIRHIVYLYNANIQFFFELGKKKLIYFGEYKTTNMRQQDIKGRIFP